VRDLASDGKLTAERTGEKFSSELFADSAIEFLDRRDRKKPFFAYVAFTAPHDPRQPPLSYREPYYRSLPPLPANFLPQLPYDNGMVKDLRTPRRRRGRHAPDRNVTREPFGSRGVPQRTVRAGSA
jgi:arylsulfatase A-like enzyme